MKIGQNAAQAAKSKVEEFVAADLDGGCGTGAVTVIAKIVQALPSCRIPLSNGTFVIHLQSPRNTSS